MLLNSSQSSLSLFYSHAAHLVLLILTLLPYATHMQVIWNNYPDIQTGQVSVYPGSSLIVAMTPAVTFTRPFTLSSTANPVAGALGITTFQIPEARDFSLITNKSITTTALTFWVQVSDESAYYVLKMAYIVMFNNNYVYRMLSKQFYCTTMAKNIGYRSEFDILKPSTVSDPFFTTTDIEATLVLEGYRLSNTQGTYYFLGATVNIPTAGTINTTFYTYEQNQVYFLQYSILFYKRTVAYQSMRQIFDIGYANFTDNSTLVNMFFSSIDTRYTSAAGRMFFGLREFNFTYLDNKIFQLDMNSYASLSSSYQFSKNTLVRIRVSFYFFVERTCLASTFFYKDLANSANDNCFASCSGFSDRPIASAATTQCLSCHYSCLTCTALTSINCVTCSAAMNRYQSGSSCLCNSGYVDNSSTLCAQCSNLIVGCQTCSTISTCLTCRSGFTGTTTCTCSTGSIVGGYCNSVYGCTSISEITGTPLCTSCNQTLYLSLAADYTCTCITGTLTLANKSCQIKCGDNYVLSSQGCDDGNAISGDGCSSTCTVQASWICIGTGVQGSTCKISTVANLQYVGVQRITNENTAQLYFNITPYFKEYKYIDYSGLLQSNLDGQRIDLSYRADENFLVATIYYTQDIESTYQDFRLYLNNTKYFWNSSDSSTIRLKGVNCELTYDRTLWMHNILKYVFLAEVIIAIIIFGISILYQKWIGLELIQTLQAIFFIFALLTQCPFEFAGLIQAFKYANGFDDILASNYARIYTLSNQLNSLSIQKEFLSNYNIMYMIMITTIIAMIIIGLLKRRYRLMLEEQISKKINDKLHKLDRIYSFIFGKIFIMLVFFSMFKIIFCFCVQLSNQTAPFQNFPDQINVTSGIFAFIIIFSMISFVLYWFLLLPNNFSEEQEFMSIQFQNMSFYYPVFYLGYQAIFILIIAITYHQNDSAYITLAFQIVYLITLIYLRPYNTLRKVNRLIHNITIIFNQVVVISFVAIAIRWNNIIGSTYQSESNYELTVYTFLILFFILISIALAVIRLVTFNQDISFKCCKKEEIDDLQGIQKSDYDHMKKMVPDDRDKYMKNRTAENAVNSFIKENEKETSPLKKKKTKHEELFQIDDTKADKFLNENFINWNRENLPTDNRPKVTRSKIKSSVAKKAELVKSPLQTYIEMRKFQREMQNNEREY